MNTSTLPLLIDFDGVLRIGDRPANYLKEFTEYLLNTGIPACIISNSTLSHSKSILDFFKDNSIVCKMPVITAADATALYVKQRYKKVAVYCADSIKGLFDDVLNYKSPKAVVIGDIGKKWNYDIMNEIFKFVYSGADLIAMHKNKFWKTPDEGLLIDAGAFISGIEYATGKKAILIGKPSPLYFQSGLGILGYNTKQNFIMLGDDLETDIKGANDLGAKTILIYTGKTNYPLSKKLEVKPDYEAQNLKEVISILKNI